MSDLISYDNKNNPYPSIKGVMETQGKQRDDGLFYWEDRSNSEPTLNFCTLDTQGRVSEHGKWSDDDFGKSKDEFIYGEDGKLVSVVSTNTASYGFGKSYINFKYDERGRLEGEYANDGIKPNQRTKKFFYDENDNVIACNSSDSIKSSWAMRDGEKVYGDDSFLVKAKMALRDFMGQSSIESLYPLTELKTDKPLVKVKDYKKLNT